MTTALKPLVCPYCDGELTSFTETVNRGYLSHEVPGTIECDDCDATWTASGGPERGPRE